MSDALSQVAERHDNSQTFPSFIFFNFPPPWIREIKVAFIPAFYGQGCQTSTKSADSWTIRVSCRGTETLGGDGKVHQTLVSGSLGEPLGRKSSGCRYVSGGDCSPQSTARLCSWDASICERNNSLDRFGHLNEQIA